MNILQEIVKHLNNIDFLIALTAGSLIGLLANVITPHFDRYLSQHSLSGRNKVLKKVELEYNQISTYVNSHSYFVIVIFKSLLVILWYFGIAISFSAAALDPQLALVIKKFPLSLIPALFYLLSLGRITLILATINKVLYFPKYEIETKRIIEELKKISYKSPATKLQ